MTKNWFITGTARRLGLEIAKATLQAGDGVAATGRSRDAVVNGLGPENDRLLAVELDVTNAIQARTRGFRSSGCWRPQHRTPAAPFRRGGR
jgi:NAD(P)-dependent dehydrogenase (short-subunit alcohol dehydrogenase family)